MGVQWRTKWPALLWAFEVEKAQAINSNDEGSGLCRKRRLEVALGETHDEFRVKLRKANGEPDAIVEVETVQGVQVSLLK